MDVMAENNRPPGAGRTSGSRAVLPTVLGAGGAALWCLLGLIPTLRVLFGGTPESVRFDWKVYDPFFERWAVRFSRLRILQHGKVQIDLVYLMFMVVLALTWMSLRGSWATS
jgi:hypothetical protein